MISYNSHRVDTQLVLFKDNSLDCVMGTLSCVSESLRRYQIDSIISIDISDVHNDKQLFDTIRIVHWDTSLGT